MGEVCGSCSKEKAGSPPQERTSSEIGRVSDLPPPFVSDAAFQKTCQSKKWICPEGGGAREGGVQPPVAYRASQGTVIENSLLESWWEKTGCPLC